MNREQRREYIKKMNTPEKIENFSKELDRRLRKEYEEKSSERIQEFIKCYTLLFAYVLDYELENEKHLRISARKGKDVSKQIAEVDRHFMQKAREHLDLLEDGTITIEEIEEYFLNERNIDFNFKSEELL